jgi:hypothetical protein
LSFDLGIESRLSEFSLCRLKHFSFQSLTLRSKVNLGWDWKTGLLAQLEERNVMYAFVARFSAAEKTTFVPAASAINFYRKKGLGR